MKTLIVFLFALQVQTLSAWAIRIEEQLPFRGDVSGQWIAINDGGSIKLIKADLQKTPEKLIISAEVEKLKSKALIAGIARFSNNEILSSNFRSYSKGGESATSWSDSDELGQVTEKLQSTKLELARLEEEVKVAGADLRKRAGLGDVDAIYQKIEALSAKIEEKKAKKAEQAASPDL